MRITSFDELQREITKLSSEFKAQCDSYAANTSVVRDILLFIDNLSQLQTKTAQLWMSALGELYSLNGAESTRYGKRISALSKAITDQITLTRKFLTGLAVQESLRLKWTEPAWFGELSAKIDCTSIRGYWTYGLDPLSVLTDAPNFNLYFRIDIRNALVTGRIDWQNQQSYTNMSMLRDNPLTPQQQSRAVKKAYNLAGVGNVYTMRNDMSIWVDMANIAERKLITNNDCFTNRYFQSTFTNLEAIHPSTIFIQHYGIRDLINAARFAKA